MSWQATAYVKALTECPDGAELSRGQKLILFVLADYHNTHSRAAFPGMKPTQRGGPGLAAEAMTSISQLRRDLRYLEEHLVLKTRRRERAGAGHITEYLFMDLDAREELEKILERKAAEGVEGEPLFAGKRYQGGTFFSSEKRVAEGSQKRCHGAPEKVPEGCHGDTRNEEGNRELKQHGTGNVAAPPLAEADARHAAIRDYICKRHAQFHDMPLELVPWDGGEGAALKKLLAKNPTLSVADACKCVENYYASDVDIAARPRRWLHRLLEFWGLGGVKNQYGTPKIRDQKFLDQERRRAKAGVGRREE